MALVNEDFVVETQMIAKSRGVPDLKYVVFPRTINSMSPEEIKKATDKVSDDVVKLLTNPIEKPVAAKQ